MSTARVVPETWELSGDDARETLISTGRGRLLADAFIRLRYADGFSHARSLAFGFSLLAVQAAIAIVGLVVVIGQSDAAEVVVQIIQDAVPGPAGALLTDAVSQAEASGHTRQYTALVLGTIGSIVTGATIVGQFERGLNRLYGVEQDRPSVEKYARATLLAVTAGGLAAIAFVLATFGATIDDSIDNAVIARAWEILCWPLAFVTIVAATALLFQYAPNRRQPNWSWLAFGAGVSIGGWAIVTGMLTVAFRLSDSFGNTYGPLAGMVALLLWAFLSAVAFLYGGAVAAQLEAVRAGAREPVDDRKNVEAETPTQPERIPTG